jgi:hypothetical protein
MPTPKLTDAEIQALDVDKLTSQQRVDLINDARIRRTAGEELTIEHLKLAIRCMRSERKVSAANAGKKTKAIVSPTSLEDF